MRVFSFMLIVFAGFASRTMAAEYNRNFHNLDGAIQAGDYMTYSLVKTVEECKTKCDSVVGCNFANSFHDVNGKGGSTDLTCSLYKTCHIAAEATNKGGQTQSDGTKTYVTDSDGWCKAASSSVSTSIMPSQIRTSTIVSSSQLSSSTMDSQNSPSLTTSSTSKLSSFSTPSSTLSSTSANTSPLQLVKLPSLSSSLAGYTKVFSGLSGAVQAGDYMTYTLVQTVEACGATCDSVVGCAFANTFYDVHKGGNTDLTCSLYRSCHSALEATNKGGQTQPDGSISYVANSDGWCKVTKSSIVSSSQAPSSSSTTSTKLISVSGLVRRARRKDMSDVVHRRQAHVRRDL